MALVAVVPVLRVDDLDAAIRFYVDVLGFHEAWRWGDPPFYAGLAISPGENSDTDVHLNRTNEDPGKSEIYLSVDDVDAVHERVRATGTFIEVELQDQAYGMRDFSVRDPSGNFLTIGTPLPT